MFYCQLRNTVTINQKGGGTDMKRGERLTKLIKEKKFTVSSLAKEAGIPYTTLRSMIENNLINSSVDNVIKICKPLGIAVEELIEDEKNIKLPLKKPDNAIPLHPSFIQIPIIGEIACGEPLLAEEQIIGYVWEFEDNVPHGELFALKAKGNSMEPTIPNGATVIVRIQNEVENGEIAAVLLNGESEATLKRLKKQNDFVMLIPDNNNYDTIVINDQHPAVVIGKAVRVIRDLA